MDPIQDKRHHRLIWTMLEFRIPERFRTMVNREGIRPILVRIEFSFSERVRSGPTNSPAQLMHLVTIWDVREKHGGHIRYTNRKMKSVISMESEQRHVFEFVDLKGLKLR
jgi:hypothetical protein